ncbi:hypothetical protein A1O3_09321 [Capronia epimyces CBS 606.96]|uniref:DUF2241 domain-containing protein n=1 Tax=Capronia epimyces CBS 606.96 TaxID=1182542 RepID=W9XLF1_9EURO|nr:uncharacterized protein A1O3_09321 [Capronia epimyces CBS 606.96]EXJ78160.1 hypothetical protein A1O3_09321 [Capronia epimyces CBS 606.96]
MSSPPPTSSTSGETSLSKLLSTLTVTLHPPTYVFLNIPVSDFEGTNAASRFPIPLAEIILFFREPGDGITVIVELAVIERYQRQDQAQKSVENDSVPDTVGSRLKTLYRYDYQYPCRMITCDVHSSLAAVGFMATLATRLARRGISVNPVSGFFHDHLFVPAEKAEEAVRVLEEVREEASQKSGSN